MIDTTGPAPEETTQPEFTDSAQSVDELLASARTAGMPPEATSVRLFAFRPEGTTERLAFAFVGPEAMALAQRFAAFADELFRAIQSRRAPDAG